jgi:type II secretory pathway pseudopilin PulG
VLAAAGFQRSCEMSAIGHNMPPPVEAMALHIEDLFSLVSGSLAAGPVANDEQEAALDAMLDDIRKARKDVDEQRAIEKRPHDDAAKAVQAAWKPLLDRCDKAADAIKAALTPYRTARQRAKDAAAAQAREEAAAAQKAAQDALRGSDDLDERFAAEEQLKLAEKLNAQANRIDRAATGLRTYWEAEITDLGFALDHYARACPDDVKAFVQGMADKDARNEATRRAIPGVAFHERKKAA